MTTNIYSMEKSKKCFSLVLLAVFSFSLSCMASTEELKVVKYQGEMPPYFFKQEGREVGGYIDIFSRLSELTKYKFKFVSFPVSRSLYLFDIGKIDIEPNVNPVWRTHTKEPGIYSIPYDKSTEIVLFSAGMKIPINSPIDLKGRHVGVVFGYRYPSYEELFKNKTIFRHNLKNEQKLLKILAAGGGIKQIFINKYTALYWKKTIPAYHNFELGAEISQLDVMMRVHPSKKHILPDLNKALRYMVEQGEIKKIYRQYQ